jgi:hypothetical protein
MNERIKELARQAALDWHKFWNDDESNRMEKFAELIVRECAKVCKSRVGNSDYNTGRMHCASDLKEHFGVEE